VEDQCSLQLEYYWDTQSLEQWKSLGPPKEQLELVDDLAVAHLETPGDS
jgi:hypothetical protein